jgi:hypothetical protein
MEGVRDIRFTSGVQVFTLEKTDFWIEYTASPRSDGNQSELGMTLHSVWEHADFTVAKGHARREYVEERFKDMIWDFVGLTGTLEIDFNTPALAHTLSGIRFNNVSISLGDLNEGLEYDLEFKYPVDGFGGQAEIARSFQFGAYAAVNSANLIVRTEMEDRTSFKRIWRAAPVRVENGPGLKTVKLEAIRKATAGATALAKRQDTEAEISTWAGRVGESLDLKVDTVSRGTHHLKRVSPGELDLPDAVTYALEFVTGYSS